MEAIGGSWGSTELEERYEYFEKSLYGTLQRSDETNDSYLSCMEANFVELLSRNTSLEEVQAYVLQKTKSAYSLSMEGNSNMDLLSNVLDSWEASSSMNFSQVDLVRRQKCMM